MLCQPLCDGSTLLLSARTYSLSSSLPLCSGSTLHASGRRPPGDPTGTDSSHANAARHYPNGPPAATRLPAHRRAHHRLLLLADRHHRHHQSGAGEWRVFSSRRFINIMAPLARRDFVMRMCPEVILSSFYVEKHTYLSE